MHEDVAAYLDAIPAERRPLFDRVHGVILDVAPEVELAFSYKMPTYVVGENRLHVAVWKHGLSFYGWPDGATLAARYPHLDNGKGTLRLPVGEAADISDDELRAFAREALGR